MLRKALVPRGHTPQHVTTLTESSDGDTRCVRTATVVVLEIKTASCIALVTMDNFTLTPATCDT